MFQHGTSGDGTHVFFDNASKYMIVSESGVSVESQASPGVSLSERVSAVIGTIRLKYNRYVIVADAHSVVGSVLGNDIGKVEKTRVLPIGPVTAAAKKLAEEKAYVALLHKHLSLATLFFSIGNKYDLTNSLQRQFTSKNAVYDTRFWWNHFVCHEMLLARAHTFMHPMIYGYFKLHTARFNQQHYLEFALVTRRAVLRAGTRYFRRGIDLSGLVANFNETEQIFSLANNQVYLLLQTRGLVPVYWAEINNLKYKPNLVIGEQLLTDATAKHFSEQIELYGDNYCVNLVNQLGYEQPVKLAYEQAVSNLPQQVADHVNYIYFDFHHECSKMRWDRVKLLLETLTNLGYTLKNYFHYDLLSSKIIQTQLKIVRTNCMDCLDRTNVVQLTVARWVLQNQFHDCGYLGPSEHTPFELLDPQFNLFFQLFWADNADAVLCAYLGTGALKTDYTRTGKRTKQGALKDLQNLISRYYKNNLSDGSRQDAYDLFLGLYKPYQDLVLLPFTDSRPPYDQLLPYLMGTLVVIFIAMCVFPRGLLFAVRNLIVLLLCVAFNFRLFKYLGKEGYQFVNWPKLVQLDYLRRTEVYDGQNKLVGTHYEEADNYRVVSKKTK